MNKNRIKLIIFDMDGTLYNFKEGSFKRSNLRLQVLSNAQSFVAKRLNISSLQARSVISTIIREYDENISIGLEKRYGIDRYDYFNNVWDIPAGQFIRKNNTASRVLKELERRRLSCALLSDAPMIWVEKVLRELKCTDFFKSKDIFSGENNVRKTFGNAFKFVLSCYRVKPEQCLVVGDQEITDIIPAKKLGMTTVFVTSSGKSRLADFNISSIAKLPLVISKLD